MIIFSFSLAAAAEKYLHLVAIVIRHVPSVNQQPILPQQGGAQSREPRRRWKDAVKNINKIVGKDTVKSINK